MQQTSVAEQHTSAGPHSCHRPHVCSCISVTCQRKAEDTSRPCTYICAAFTACSQACTGVSCNNLPTVPCVTSMVGSDIRTKLRMCRGPTQAGHHEPAHSSLARGHQAGAGGLHAAPSGADRSCACAPCLSCHEEQQRSHAGTVSCRTFVLAASWVKFCWLLRAFHVKHMSSAKRGRWPHGMKSACGHSDRGDRPATLVTVHDNEVQIAKAFHEQHPDARKAWIDDGIKEIAFQDAVTRAWVLKPAWAPQPGAHRSLLEMRYQRSSWATALSPNGV